MNVAYNMDCMEYMRSLPDKAFDLAVVDPPYGGGATAQERERERESCTAAGQIMNGASAAVSAVGGAPIISVARTGGTWSRKYQRERPGRRISVIGILLRRPNTSQSWPASAKIKSFGAEIILPCRLRAAFLYGAS